MLHATQTARLPTAAPEPLSTTTMCVVKRSGARESVSLDKISNRIEKLAKEAPALLNVSAISIAVKVVAGIFDGVSTEALDDLAVEEATHAALQHYDYSKLAARIAISSLYKKTLPSFSETMRLLHENADPVVSDAFAAAVAANADVLDAFVDEERDKNFDVFGFKTLEKSYLLKAGGKIAERPQHLFLRTAVGIHMRDLDAVRETYRLMSEGYFTHATPTLFNAGTTAPQMSSCFLLTMREDSISGIFETVGQCADISKSAGGIGIAVHKVRASGTPIAGTNGTSNGLVPMLQVFNATARYVDQGGGKRKGAFAVYLEPWHADVEDVLELRRPGGKEEHRARDLFFGLWTPDLFMRRVAADERWSLFCPRDCPRLDEVHGAAFDALYARYEEEGRAKKVLRAQELWKKIVASQIESGTPYILFKDACNAKSNQQNLGTIQSSNLCTEIVQYTSRDEIAVCNLASVCLPKFVVVASGGIDHQTLFEVVYHVTGNLNKVIDANAYPVEEARASNRAHRPIGIGVQGLADVFMKLRLDFESDEARAVNEAIFETIYFAAMTASVDLALADGPYASFAGSPLSMGKFQFDLWGEPPASARSGRWDWGALRVRVQKWGARNSLLVAPMPTASTAQILGNVEAFEPITSNVYVRRVLSGEYPVINKHLVDRLLELGLWTPETRRVLLRDGGSVKNVAGLSDADRAVFKTAFEMSMKSVVDMAAARGKYVCQSQSLNVFMEKPTSSKISSYLFYAWKRGLKTGVYYLRSRPAAEAIKFTVEAAAEEEAEEAQAQDGEAVAVCRKSKEEEEECLSCGA